MFASFVKCAPLLDSLATVMLLGGLLSAASADDPVTALFFSADDLQPALATESEIDQIAETRWIQITKGQIGGDVDYEFTFEIVCFSHNSTPNDTDRKEVVLQPEEGVVLSDPIPVADPHDTCTVREIGASSPNGLDDWIVTPAAGETQTLVPGETTVFEFINALLEPTTATVDVRKDFDGPDDWTFGFTLNCVNGPHHSFVLGGGEQAQWQVDRLPNFGLTCSVIEEELQGEWTTDITISLPRFVDITDNAVSFRLLPEAGIDIVFRNQAGYLALPPTGQPPGAVGLQ